MNTDRGLVVAMLLVDIAILIVLTYDVWIEIQMKNELK